MNILREIQEHGWTLEKLSSEMTVAKGDRAGEKGISSAALSQIINKNPTLERLKEIASIIGISVAELVREENEKKESIVRCPNCGAVLTLKVEV